MAETKQQVTQRKIRNGLRKQAAVIQYEKEKIWEILKRGSDWNGVGYKGGPEEDTGSFYCPYVPIMKKVSTYPILLTGNEVFIGELTK